MHEATTFVGRGTELARLDEELDAARAGRPRVVIVEGPPGIGKTTLVERFLVAAPDVHVARASGDEAEIEVAFGVLDQLLRRAGTGTAPPGGGHVEAGALLLDTIGALQADGPAVLFLDDAHWADAESLKAVLFAVRRLVTDSVLVVLVVRTAERLPEGLVKAATSVRVAALAADEVHDLAHGLGVTVSARGARRLFEHSGGSPLYAHALLGEVPADAWDDANATLPAPRSFAELVVGRMRDWPDDAVALLEAAAVLGLRSPLAAAASTGAVGEALDAVEPALRADLVGVDHGSAGLELRFAHPLVRAAVYQHLGPSRRAQLHLAAAAVVEDEAVAFAHRVAASPGADPALADALEAFAQRCAGERRWANATSAWVAAGRLSADRAARERRLLDGIEAAMYAGDAPRARALAAETAGFAPGARLDAVLAYVAVANGDRAEAEARLERAWNAGDPELAARIAERRSFLGVLRMRPAEAVEWAERSRAALPAGDPARNRPVWSLALSLHELGRRDEAFALLEGPPLGAMKGGLLLAQDDLDGAHRHYAAEKESSGSLVVAARTLARRTHLEFAAGRWDEAVVLAERALLLATEADEVAAQTAAGWAATLVPGARGDSERCAQLIADLEALEVVFEAHAAPIWIAKAGLADTQGRPAGVLAALAPAVALASRDAIDHPGHWPWAHLYAGALPDPEAFVAEHDAIAERHGVASMRARLARVRAAATEDHDAAEAALRFALDVLPPGMPYERALTELALGRVLRRAGHRRAAAAELTAARATFEALDARPMLARCIRELDACGLTPVKRGPGADRSRLTPQERSVALLVASGRSNRDVAAELLLSVKTVERHLTHVYRKLGVSTRAELSTVL